MDKDTKLTDDIVKYLLLLKRHVKNDGTHVYADKESLRCLQINITESEFIEKLGEIQEAKLIDFKFTSVDRKMSSYIDIILRDPIFNYSKNKKKEKRKLRRAFWQEFRAWITLVIALCGLVISIYSCSKSEAVKEDEDSSYTQEESSDINNHTSSTQETLDEFQDFQETTAATPQMND